MLSKYEKSKTNNKNTKIKPRKKRKTNVYKKIGKTRKAPTYNNKRNPN